MEDKLQSEPVSEYFRHFLDPETYNAIMLLPISEKVEYFLRSANLAQYLGLSVLSDELFNLCRQEALKGLPERDKKAAIFAEAVAETIADNEAQADTMQAKIEANAQGIAESLKRR